MSAKSLNASKRQQSIRIGHRCSRCELWIYPGDGRPRLCVSCTKIASAEPAPPSVAEEAVGPVAPPAGDGREQASESGSRASPPVSAEPSPAARSVALWPGAGEPTIDYIEQTQLRPVHHHAVDVLNARHDRSGK
jgi:hypothetical protein